MFRASQNQFNGGQWSERLRDRYDLQGYSSAVATLDDGVPLVHGPATKRPGTRDIGAANNTIVRLIDFVFSNTAVFTLEFTNLACRIYSGDTVVDSVVTPYTAAQLFEFTYVRSGNVTYFAHPDVTPQKLVRFADNDWRWFTVNFSPFPSYEDGSRPATTLTLGAASGTGVTATAGASVFNASDVDRIVSEIGSTGVAIIGSRTSGTVVTIDILSAFTDVTLNSGTWELLGSPVSTIRITDEKTGPIGARMSIHSFREQSSNTNLITNGTFASGATGWDNYSAPLVASGTATGGDDDGLADSGATFVTDGVQVGHIAHNTTDTEMDRVEGIVSETEIDTFVGGTVWGAGKDYEIHQSGTTTFVNDVATLNGGENGIAWIEQDIATTVDTIYRMTFRVSNAPLSVQIGSATKGADTFGEATFELGENEVIFQADATTTYIQFRNNQNANAVLDNVECRVHSVATFQATDVGKFVYGNEGCAEIVSFVDAFSVVGVIRKPFANTADIENWTLESRVWTASLGYPKTVALFDQRAYYGSTTTFPVTLWGSRVGSYEDFAHGVADDDSFTFELATNEANQFVWMLGETNLIIGTAHEEITISGGSNTPVTPTNVLMKSVSHYGSAAVTPVRVGSSILFVEQSGTRIRELAFDADFTDRLERESIDLTLFAPELFVSGIRQMAYQQTPDSLLWVLLNDGTLCVGALDRTNNVVGWATLSVTGGVHSITPIPSTTEVQMWTAVFRGSTTRLERFDFVNGHFGKLTVDSATIYDGVATTTISGLSRFEGGDVAVMADGANFGTFTVSGGEITLPSSVTYAEVGLPITFTMTTLRPGNENTPTIGLTSNQGRITVGLLDSLGGTINDVEIPYRTPQDDMDEALTPFTGYVFIDADADGDDNTTVTIVHSEPLPFTITSISRNIETSRI